MATRVVAVGRRLRQGWRCRRRLVRRVIRRLQRALFLFQASKPPVDSCCPRCSHAMRPQDHPVKFMLFVCASCGHQKQLDFEFSWRETYVNGIRILPQVKDQGDETTCVFFAIATAIEAMLNMEMAQRGERYSESISISDMVEYFENCKWESSVPKKMELGLAKIKTCLEMLQTIGALTQKGKKKPEELLQASDYVRIKDSCWHDGLSFEEVCTLVLEGKMLVTIVPITDHFHELKADEIYDCTHIQWGASETFHAMVIVEFGVKDGKTYFRVQNSHGSYWADFGFGMIRDNSIAKILQLIV